MFQATLLNATAVFELWIHCSVGARILPSAVGGLIISCDNPLDFHAIIVSVLSSGLVKEL